MSRLKTMQEELDAMEKALEEPNAGEEELRTDPPGTDAPGTQAPGTKAPSTESPSTESPSTQTPATEPPPEDPRDKELRELKERLAAVEEREKSPKTKAPKTSPPQTEAPISEEDFLGEMDLDDLTRDPSQFQSILNKVYKKGVEFARAEARKSAESIVRSIPDIVKNNVALNTRLKKIHDQFYSDNEDLLPWKKSVASVMEELISEQPDKTYEELLPQVATEVRKRLGLHKDANRRKDDNPPPPPPRKKGGQRQQSKPDTDPMLKELDEMDKALGLD